MSPDLEALRLRVERAELEARLLDALIRIRLAGDELSAARIRTELAIGIHREREHAYAGASGSGA